MERIGPIPRNAEVLIVFNGFPKHLEEGKYYRKTLDRLFRSPPKSLQLVVDEKEVAVLLEKKRGSPTPCNVEFAQLFPDRSSAVLILHDDAVEGFAFTHESIAVRLTAKEALRVWKAVNANIKKPKRGTT